jgi:hypothetical protein
MFFSPMCFVFHVSNWEVLKMAKWQRICVPAEDIDCVGAPILHSPFPDSLRTSVRLIQEAFADVWPRTVEEWEDGLRRELHHQKEIGYWLCMADTYKHFTAGRDLSNKQRKDIFGVIVAASRGEKPGDPPLTLSWKRVQEIREYLAKLWAQEQVKYPSNQEQLRNSEEFSRRLASGMTVEEAVPDYLR